MRSELNTIDQQIKRIEQDAQAVLESGEPQTECLQRFHERVQQVLESSRRLLQDQSDSLQECHQMFKELVCFFSWRPRSSTEDEQLRDFFGFWLPFCADFKDLFNKQINARIKAVVDQAKREANQRKSRKSKELTEEKKKLSPFGLKAKLLKKKILNSR